MPNPLLWSLLGLSVLLIILSGVCYWGAGVILHPPNMAKMAVFPEMFGLKAEKVSFPTRDGLTLKGWFFPTSDPGAPTLVMCHGWGDNKGYLLQRTHFLISAGGFNVLYFDNRSHGESEGTITTIGYLETVDFEGALRFLRENKPRSLERLGVFGMSMGAAVAVMSMPDHPEIKAAVLESPFPSYRNVIRRWAWNNMRVPYFPLVLMSLFFLKIRVGDARVDSYSPLRFVKRIAPRPLFLIGGSEDALMPECDIRELYAAAEEPKQIWFVPGAAHGRCHEASPDEYEARVLEFFRKNL